MTGSKRPPKSTNPAAHDPAAAEFKPPLKPRPVLFVVLGLILLIWLGVLVWMRLTTVKPTPAPPPPPQSIPRSAR